MLAVGYFYNEKSEVECAWKEMSQREISHHISMEKLNRKVMRLFEAKMATKLKSH